MCSGRTVTCTCITGNSDSLAWTSNGNTLSFTSTAAVPMRQNVSGSNQFAVLTENSDVNGIRVIMSNFTINVSSDVSDIILTCENVDHAITEPIIIPVIPYGKCYMHTLQLYCPNSRRTVPIFCPEFAVVLAVLISSLCPTFLLGFGHKYLSLDLIIFTFFCV